MLLSAISFGCCLYSLMMAKELRRTCGAIKFRSRRNHLRESFLQARSEIICVPHVLVSLKLLRAHTVYRVVQRRVGRACLNCKFSHAMDAVFGEEVTSDVVSDRAVREDFCKEKQKSARCSRCINRWKFVFWVTESASPLRSFIGKFLGCIHNKSKQR